MSAVYQIYSLCKLIVSLSVSKRLTDNVKEACLKAELLISRL